MKVTKQINFQDVEALSREILTGKASMERFSVEISVSDCANGIYAGMRAEVMNRGNRMRLDEHIKSCLLQAADWLANPNGCPGLMLMGLCGNGKTSLARGIANFIAYITEKELGYTARKAVRFHTAKQITQMAVAKSQERYRKAVDEELLIIDDLGEEAQEVMSYGNITNPLLDLLLERYDRRRFTIVTTNLEADQLKATYGDRLYDRFREMMKTITFTHDSYRTPDHPVEHP